VPSLNPLLLSTDAPPMPASQLWKDAYDGRCGRLIDLAQAVPGSPPRALLDRLAATAGTLEATAYGAILGDAALREALAADLGSLYSGRIAPSDIAITAGCNQAFFVTMLALARRGDAVILPTPWYFNHKMTLDMLGVDAVPLPCRADRGFIPTVEDARALIGPMTRAIVLVSPNNPTGAIYPEATFRAFQHLARETGVILVLDETYRDFLPDGAGRPHDLFATPAWRDTTLQLYSFSKSYAIPGHRLGAITADSSLLAEIVKVLDCMTICPPRVAQPAVAWAVEGTRAWRTEIRATINRRAASFGEIVSATSGWSISAIGAYFAYVRHPFAATALEAAERLATRAGVIALPGSFFGPGQEDHLRFAFANADERQLESLAERLAAATVC